MKNYPVGKELFDMCDKIVKFWFEASSTYILPCFLMNSKGSGEPAKMFMHAGAVSFWSPNIFK